VKNLCTALINAARFLELSSGNVVDPDSAVAAMEDMSAALQSATLPERLAFITSCEAEAVRLRSAGELESSRFVAELPAALGLSVEA